MGVGAERPPSASQMQAAVQASREVFLSGKIPPPEKEDTENQGRGQNFNPEEINPPVQTKGGLTALLHASRQGHLDAAPAPCSMAAPTSTRPARATAPARC